MEKRFLTTGTPLIETFSFRRNRPCLFEQPSQPQAEPAGKCPYRDECDSTAGGLPLRLAYGRALHVTLAEASSSIVVRSEHQYSKDERHRLCLRKHIYELNSQPDRRFRMTAGVVLAVKNQLKSQLESEGGTLSLSYEVFNRIIDMLKQLSERGDECMDPNHVKNELLLELRGLEIGGDQHDRIVRIVQQHATAALACHSIDDQDVLSRYIGFVDLRTNSTRAPLAMGVLVPPRDLRHDSGVTMVAGEYGRVFGAHGFSGTVYSMHDPVSSGARCAQACIIMALAMLSDRRANVLGSYDVTYLGKDRVEVEDWAAECLYNRPRIKSAFHIDGLRPQEIVRVLQHSECRTSADSVMLPHTWTNYRMCKRLIEAYVSARCPVIMGVDTAEWWGRKKSAGHAVLIVGIRKSLPPTRDKALDDEVTMRVASSLSELTELVIHDPGYLPFMKRPFEQCLKAASAFAGRNAYHLVFPADDRIRLHASRCLMAIQFADPTWETYFGVPDRSMDDEFVKKSASCDYRIALVHLNDLVKTYTDPSYSIAWLNRKYKENSLKPDVRARFEDLRKAARNLPSAWYWCITGYRGLDLEVLWLFNAGSKGTRRPDCRIDLRTRTIDVAPSVERDETANTTQDGFPASGTEERPQVSLPEEDELEEERPGGTQDPIHTSVITSSSCRSLADLIEEVRAVSRVSLLDVFVLRDTDIEHMEAAKGPLKPKRLNLSQPDNRTSAQILARDENLKPIVEWICEQFHSSSGNAPREVEAATISALATYYPQITARSHWDDEPKGTVSWEKIPFRVAQSAIVNTVRLALRLKHACVTDLPERSHQDAENTQEKHALRPLMDHAVIEVVCGTIVDQCDCASCGKFRSEEHQDRRLDIVFETEREAKIRMLCDRLLEVVEHVNQSDEGKEDPCWALALELEPGPTYVFNNLEAIRMLIRCLEEGKYKKLRPHVGINLDVAHMKIARVDATDLVEFNDWIVHAHICDHPEMHTRDQIVGTWSQVDRYDGRHYPYLRLLAEIDPTSKKREGRPFTGTIALELEGCSRIGWIHQSLVSMKRMTEVLKHHRRRIPLQREREG